MGNTRIRSATLLLFLALVFKEITYSTCDDLMDQKSIDIISQNIMNSTSDGINIRQKRQFGFYPYGYYRPRPIPIILGGVGIGFGGPSFGFGRPGFGFGRGFGGFGGRGFGGFGGRGFGGRGFGGFGGRGFGGFGGRGFGGFGGRGGRG